MSLLPKLLYRLRQSSCKDPSTFFVETEKSTLKLMWKDKGTQLKQFWRRPKGADSLCCFKPSWTGISSARRGWRAGTQVEGATESPGERCGSAASWFSTKAQKQFSAGKIAFSVNSTGATDKPQAETADLMASLVVQRPRIRLAMQGAPGRPWSGKTPHATGPLSLQTNRWSSHAQRLCMVQEKALLTVPEKAHPAQPKRDNFF